MSSMLNTDGLIKPDDPILITGAAGYVGSRVVKALHGYGFRNIRCFIRHTSVQKLKDALGGELDGVHVIPGSILSKEDCEKAVLGVKVIIQLAAGTGKDYAVCITNSVVTTRNLLDAAVKSGSLKRFVNISSFAVYSNHNLPRRKILDETCMVEPNILERHEAYAFGKIKQDELVEQYGKEHGIPYVIMRPSVVFGPGKSFIPSRVGIGSFGIFLHIGGSIRIPITYVDNCADAIARAAFVDGVDGEVFNIVDDDLPTSRKFLSLYKKKVKRFPSIRLPYPIAWLVCYLWERYANFPNGQIPPVYNRNMCEVYWKGNRYSNKKLKEKLGWMPKVPMSEALQRYFDYQKQNPGAQK